MSKHSVDLAKAAIQAAKIIESGVNPDDMTKLIRLFLTVGNLQILAEIVLKEEQEKNENN